MVLCSMALYTWDSISGVGALNSLNQVILV